MNFDIVEVFTRAAKITWKHKVLWIFGILASCGRRSGGNSNSGGSGNDGGTGGNPFNSEMMRQAQAFFESLGRWLEQNTWIIFALIVFVFIVVILQIFFTLVGTAGLARGVVKVENGAEHLVFGELFSESLSYFWRLFGAALVIWLPVMTIFFGLLFVGMIPLMSSAQSGGNILAGVSVVFFLALCCCMFPIFIAVGLYHVQVKRSILVDDLGVFGSLARGWQVFSQNIIGLLIVGVVIFIASFIIGLLLAIPVLLLTFPLMVSFMQGNITSWQPFIAVGIFLICYGPLAWFIAGILTTYTESVWTLAYLRITKPKEEAPVMIEANA